MTAHGIALGLRSKYPMQAARAKAFRKYLQWMGPTAMGRASWDAVFDEKRSRHLTFWTQVCLLLDKEPSDVCDISDSLLVLAALERDAEGNDVC